MNMNLSTKKITLILLSVSFIGFFMPWFYFSKSVDYSIGLTWLSNIGFILGYFGSIVFVLINEKSKAIRVCTLIFLSFLPITCIYEFFTWHIQTITGGPSIRASFQSTHYGFYVTLISTSIAFIINLIYFIKKKV